MSRYKILFFILLLLIIKIQVQAQENTDKWDNELWTGARLAWGESKWIYSVEYQPRFNQNIRQLDRWFLEGSLRYLAGKHFELIPDYRFSVRTSVNEHRLGAGMIYKTMFKKIRFINQFKVQLDKPVSKAPSWAIRNIVFFNYLLNEKWTPYVGAGPLYRLRHDFNGFEIIRVGAGFHYKIDPKHLISFNYYLGSRDTGQEVVWNGVVFVQITFTLDKDFKYVPANFVGF